MSKINKYAVFDLDGTLIRWQLFHSVVDYLGESGKLPKDVYSSVIESRNIWRERKHSEAFKSYENEIIDAYEGVVKDLSLYEFEDIAKKVFNKHKDHVYVYTRNLMKTLHDNGYMIFAVSGSFDQIVKMIAKYYGFDDSAGSKHFIKEGKFTGELDVVQSKRKVEKIIELENIYGLSKSGSIAIGDSMGDIDMLSYVENPIVFNPVKDLFEEAKKRHWKIVIERKNTIYELNYNNGEYELRS